jgi:alkanesulfonate monooxygenase SsuD/methylene tetrahydromethanopterin reductase-like flavin-dependent oxidoreductase (luciferase family)
MHIVSNFDNKGAAEQIRRFSEDHARLNPDKPMPRLGITRFFHVAETDAEAEARGRQAYRSWYESYATLWRKFDHRPALTDDEAADRRAQGTAIYGTPETVRAAIERDIEATGADYFATRFAYGDLTRDESTRSLELFTSEVLPHFEIDNTPR